MTGDIATLLHTGPFHRALRAAVAARGLTLDRLRVRLGARGVPVGLSTLSDWQHGRSRPSSPLAVEALSEILRLPPGALAALLQAPTDPPPRTGLAERDGALAELLDALPGSRRTDLEVLSRQDKVRVDDQRRSSSLWQRTCVRASRDGVDRYVVRHFGDTDGSSPAAELVALENCRVGRVLRHQRAPVLVAELLFGQALHVGDTWVFETLTRDRSPGTSTAHAYGFRHAVAQYLLEVRFHPSALPASCYSFVQAGLAAERRRTGELALSSHHAVHLVAADMTGGLLGIGWRW
ncbi:hypothetical protein QLQ12_44170 [Actinoplanes sp. NEAU-A12]|uniref:Transcriptional regulator n=1 Tax=Actinoplanes sandaracinus TaxID=3045177 RepID=A0ABT6X0R5_9ACTN|nr:hypothetical protein [Actinoplanes sandaracinus]MDI6105599.1 hypothetical protein [Actinoplanes sandaracinus]